MREIVGTSNQFLEIDLSTRSYHIQEIPARDRHLYLGAKGLGLKLIFDRISPGVDPLGPDNILAVMPGVLMGTWAPCSGRFHAVSKSPLTGIFTTSSCGGGLGRELKTAGWDGMLVRGQSEVPIRLEITSKGVRFWPADHLWGLEISEARKVMDQKAGSSLIIGPAGENLVRFANISSDQRFLGRGGLGAVLGSKRVKAITALGGDYRIIPARPKQFTQTRQRAQKYIRRNRMTAFLYTRFGTNANVNPNNSAGILPVDNFSRGRHDQAWQLSGETIKVVHETTHHTCKPCSVLCGHKGTFNHKIVSVPEYETSALLGSNLGIFDREQVSEWNQLCSELGLDTISTGAVLGWCMEAEKKGIYRTGLRFGHPEGIREKIEQIGCAREQGTELGRGTRWLSQTYGGQEFAIQVKGLEMPGYDPRNCFGQGLAYAVANRGACHLSAFLVAMEIYFGLLKPMATRAKPQFVAFFEGLTNCVNSLQTCQFTMFAYTLEPALSRYTPTPILRFLMQNLPSLAIALVDFSVYTRLWSSTTGIRISNRSFLRAGQRIHLLERYMNTREGITSQDDTLPDKMLHASLGSNPDRRSIPLEKMLKRYYRIRGYSGQGTPKKRVLRKYQIPAL